MFYKEISRNAKQALLGMKTKLLENRFREVHMGKFQQMALRYKRDSELGADMSSISIFNRGLDSRNSNFFVFLGTEKNFLGKETLKVLYYNPAPPNVRYNFRPGQKFEAKERGDTIVTRVYEGKGNPDDFVSNTVGDIMDTSAAKPCTRYYYWPHNHAGYLHYNGQIHRLIDMKGGVIPGISGPVDDGKSSPFDIMLSAALFNGDYFAITSHNNFSMPVFEELDTLGKALGISVVPGVEFTMPLSSYNPEDVTILFSNMNERLEARGATPLKAKEGSFRYSKAEIDSLLHWYSKEFGAIDFDVPMRAINGPHVVAMFDRPELAERINYLMLGNKDVKYPPFSAPGVELFSTTKTLKQNYKDRVFIMIAHPFADLSLPYVGVGSRLETGDLGWKDSTRIFTEGLADGVAAYNPSIKPEWHNFNKLDFSILDKYPSKYRNLLKSWVMKRNELIDESSKKIAMISDKKWGFPAFSADALNIAYARWLTHSIVPSNPNSGQIIRMGEPDTHFYGHFSFDDVHANHLMRTVSYVEGDFIDKTPKGLLNALFKAKRGQGVEANYYAYAEMDRGQKHLVFDKDREPTKEESMEEQLKYITNYGMGFINVILPDIVKRAFLKTGLPISKTLYLINKFIKE